MTVSAIRSGQIRQKRSRIRSKQSGRSHPVGRSFPRPKCALYSDLSYWHLILSLFSFRTLPMALWVPLSYELKGQRRDSYFLTTPVDNCGNNRLSFGATRRAATRKIELGDSDATVLNWDRHSSHHPRVSSESVEAQWRSNSHFSWKMTPLPDCLNNPLDFAIRNPLWQEKKWACTTSHGCIHSGLPNLEGTQASVKWIELKVVKSLSLDLFILGSRYQSESLVGENFGARIVAPGSRLSCNVDSWLAPVVLKVWSGNFQGWNHTNDYNWSTLSRCFVYLYSGSILRWNGWRMPFVQPIDNPYVVLTNPQACRTSCEKEL